jgi:hypothetical protein
MADAEKITYPRVPESNWWTLRDQFSKTMPTTVTVSYLKSLLSFTSEKAARNLISPLQILGLIDADNKPTALANSWRNDSTYVQACKEMLEIYPQDLRELYSGSNIDRKSVQEWFQFTARLGQTAASQSAALYVLLNDATPKSSADFAKPKKNTKKTSTSKATDTSASAKPPEPTTDAQSDPGVEVETSEDSNHSSNHSDEDQDNWFSLHVDLQIHISPEASAEQIDQIFESMAKHIKTMKRTTPR